MTKTFYIPNLSGDDYHRKYAGLSNSAIKLLLDCPQRYHYKYLSGKYEEEDTAALRFGKILHTLALEPDEWCNRYYVLPEGLDRRTKLGKETYETACREHFDKVLLKVDEFAQAQAMAESLRRHKVLTKWGKGGLVERSYFLEREDGVILKTRPDIHNDTLVIDVKTTESVAQENFLRSVFKYGYHTQAALSLDIMTKYFGRRYDYFILLAVEKKAPYLTGSYILGDDIIARGREDYRRAIEIYKECIAKNEWPGYEAEEKIVELKLPYWMETAA